MPRSAIPPVSYTHLAHVLVIVGVFLLLILMVMSGFSSCGILFSGGTQVSGQTMYLSLIHIFLQLRGVRPFLSDKYDLTQHPNYKLTSDRCV